ncbi:taurochenodeoxycholic 6 alpha-hydroxylase-like [Vipera latastei]
MVFMMEKTSSFYQLMLIASAFCLAYVLAKIIQLYHMRHKQIKVYKNFPGPPPHWLYGNIHQIPAQKELKHMLEWSEQYSYAFPRWFGSFFSGIVVSHPEYAKALFARGDPKAELIYEPFIPWIGKGLITLNGTKWHQHRRLLTPAFHYNILKPYVALIADSTKIMLDKWEKLTAKEPTKSLEMFDHVSLMTLDSLMRCAFSHNSSCQTDRDMNCYVQATSDLDFLTFRRITSTLLRSYFLYSCTPSGKKFKQACKLVHHHTGKVIEERKKSLHNERELEKIQKKRHLDFLDILLCAKYEDGTGLSDEDVRAEVNTFMSAGHETTTSGFSWLLYIMAKHPEHQQKCREEIKDILGDREDIQWDDLGKMTYCTMCIKESLRIYSPVPVVSRKLSKPITFFDGRTLPEDTIVAVDIYSLHKNPSIWPDPLEFDPMRFSSENVSKRHSHAFIPFAAGARNCIGQQFAMNELKIAFALTLLRFELMPDPEKTPIPISQIVLKSENGIHLILKKLN